MLLVRLAAMPGMTCEAAGSAEYMVTPWRFPSVEDWSALGVKRVYEAAAEVDCGYPVRLIPDFHASLAARIERDRPDVVWSQLEGALPVLRLAARLGVTGLCYVHDAEFDRAEMREIAALDCHLIASSAFLAEKVYRATGRRPQVLYPPAELYFDIHGDPAGLVTMINPHAVKGLDTLLEVARQRPAVLFLLQESWKLDERACATLAARLSELPNVRFAERVSEMRGVYRQTRLLLVPSRWEEGFGMVALEAASCGIPVIASRRGGLPEAVGDGGILIDAYQDVNAWLRALDDVLSSSSRYQRLANVARQHAASQTFAPDALARRLAGILGATPQRPSWLQRAVFSIKQRFIR
jgi:glycosyltransferase involved in cell wall biosynthesis